MREPNKNPLTVGAMQGISTEHLQYSNNYREKRKPKYFYELKNIPLQNPILIAIDWFSCNFIRRHHGLCLLCDQHNCKYDFDFCYQCEVWILYSQKQKFNLAISLAHELQKNGVDKVVVIAVGGNNGK